MATDKELSNIRGPFRVHPKKKKEEPISTMDEYQKEFIKALEGYDVRQKKPVRWNFLKDNEGMFNLSMVLDPALRTSIALANKKDPVKMMRENKINERDYIDGFDEIAKGIETGRHELTTSLGELLFMGTDGLTNANFQRDFQKMMDKQKPDEPETWRGDLAALMVTYGAPEHSSLKVHKKLKFYKQLWMVLLKKN